MRQFDKIACVDWSGAKTERPDGIAVAIISAVGPPALLAPEPRWSRADVRDWLLGLSQRQENILIGFDLSMSLPFLDKGRYFPEWSESPSNARDLWKLVERHSASEPHLGANKFLAHPQATRHFRHSKEYVGDLFEPGTGRLRFVEQYQRETDQGNSASCFNLVGAAQVGKSSLTGMRMLHQLGNRIPIWPFDPVPETGPVIVEIYTTIAALAAGLPKGKSKVRNRIGLEAALRNLNTPVSASLERYDDHCTDALITAAWMKQGASDPRLWKPSKLTEDIAQKEGWTFGVF